MHAGDEDCISGVNIAEKSSPCKGQEIGFCTAGVATMPTPLTIARLGLAMAEPLTQVLPTVLCAPVPSIL